MPVSAKRAVSAPTGPGATSVLLPESAKVIVSVPASSAEVLLPAVPYQLAPAVSPSK
jgi:hypothetical protein